MGRSYSKDERRAGFEPTKEQIEKIINATKAGLHHDEYGNTQWEFTKDDIASLRQSVKELGLTKAQQKEILEKGLATDDYLLLRTLQILEDEAKGKFKNDADDKNFKFSLDKLMESWKHGQVEMLAVYDKHNRFLGYSVGNGDSVKGNIFVGMMAGGKSIHIHPTTKEAPLGGSFSRQDFFSLRASGEKTMIVTTREGVYTLEAPSGKPRIKNKDVNTAWVKLDTVRVLNRNYFDSNLGGIRKKDGSKKDEYLVIQWRDHHHAVQQLAQQVGLKYTFKPRKGYEFLTSTNGEMKSLPKWID